MLAKMDPIVVTNQLPLLKRLEHNEKVQYINFYQRLLAAKPYRQVVELHEYVQTKLSTFKLKRQLHINDQRLVAIHDNLIDQYNRLNNIITDHLLHRPIQ